MLNMLTFTATNSGNIVVVNANHIDMINIHNDGCRIYFSGGSFIDVRESLEAVINYLETGIKPATKKKFDSLFED